MIIPNTPPRYNSNIVESGVKLHKPPSSSPPQKIKFIQNWVNIVSFKIVFLVVQKTTLKQLDKGRACTFLAFLLIH